MFGGPRPGNATERHTGKGGSRCGIQDRHEDVGTEQQGGQQHRPLCRLPSPVCADQARMQVAATAVTEAVNAQASNFWSGLNMTQAGSWPASPTCHCRSRLRD